MGVYWHLLPEAKQARKAIWTAINPHTGIRRIDEAFPPEIRANTNDTEMFIRFKCGSTWQVVGSDNFNSLVGSPPVGIVFSEWALADPRAWGYFRPIWRENKGWALFISTPRGHNHLESSLKLARSEPEYFAEVVTAGQSGVFAADDLVRERKELIEEYGKEYGEAMFEQEYNCSFNAAVIGSYYGYLIETAQREGRITGVEYDTDYPVHTFWDLGLDDHMAIWFVQFVGNEIRWIDYESGGGVGLDDYIALVKAKPYDYGQHYGPHDLRVRELTRGGLSRIEYAAKQGINFKIVPELSVADGRQALREVLKRSWFDKTKCENGINGIQQHRAEWDAEKKILSKKPLKDWTGHACFTGDTEVLTRNGTHRIKDLPSIGQVLTPCGWKQYHSPRITRRNARLVQVVFKDGYTVKCTPEHLFLTDNGWKSAQSLTSISLIRSSLIPSPYSLREAYIAVGRMRDILLKEGKIFIGTCGRLPSEIFLRILTCTIRTTILITTPLTILSVCQPRNICRLLGAKVAMPEKADLATKPEKRRLNGTVQTRAGCGTAAMQNDKHFGRHGCGAMRRVKFVEKLTNALSGMRRRFKSIVDRIAGLLPLEGVTILEEESDVWCLTVPDAGCFSLGNGAVVHNCDSARYVAVQWKEIVKEAPPPFKRKEMLFSSGGDGKIRSNISIRQYVEDRARRRQADD